MKATIIQGTNPVGREHILVGGFFGLGGTGIDEPEKSSIPFLGPPPSESGNAMTG